MFFANTSYDITCARECSKNNPEGIRDMMTWAVLILHV